MDRACKNRKRKLGGARHKSRNDGGVAESAEMAVDQWLDLPSGPLGLIFSKLNPIDVILVVPLVCKYWGQIFLKQIFCRTGNSNCLDFTPLLYEPFYSFFCRLGDVNVRAMKSMNLLVGVMHAFASDSENDAHNSAVRPTSITEITFNTKLPFYDRHLVYIAERCPELRSILLPWPKNITGIGISRAMRCWSRIKRMVHVPLTGPRLLDLRIFPTIQEIGINCKNLHYILLCDIEFQWQLAEVIVRNLKSLDAISLLNVKISKIGLQTFLSRHKKLIELTFYSCYYMNNKDIDEQVRFKIWNIPEGRRIKWKTDIYSDKMGELYTSKDLVDLLWKRNK